MPGPDHKRVVITGVGLLTALGTTREVSWQALKQGKCGARRLEGIETGLGDDAFGAPAALPDGDSRTEPILQIVLATAREAVADSQLELEAADRERIGCFVGTSKNGWQSICRALNRFHRNGEADAELWQSFLPYWPTSILAREFNLRGPLSCPAAACSTGAVAVLKGAESIRDGYCDVALCGCADASLEPMVLASYSQLGVLARGFDDPTRACRPFDTRRNGFLIGEGGMTCVVESLVHARERGAPIYAELLAGASWADGRHFIHLDPDSDVLV